MAYILPVPSDTREILQKKGTACSNAYLLLNRFLEGEYNGSDKPFDIKNTKISLYRKIQNIVFDTQPHIIRQSQMLDKIKKSGSFSHVFELISESRMVVGLGDANALEVGMTLHPLYGFPYIPGSAIKGLTRTWLEIAEDTFDGSLLEGENLNRVIREKSREIFGSTTKDSTTLNHRMGKVTFLDAIPVTDNEQTIEFDIDIMNPHYSNYYSDPEQNPPGDWYRPIPIPFLTIKPKTKFQFGIIAEDEVLLKQASAWLMMGLSELGIGAKTSSGYGYFTHPDELKRREEEKRKEEEEERPDWAKELEKESEEELKIENQLTDTEKIEKLIKKGPPKNTFNDAYKLWSDLPEGDEKLRLANLFFEVDSKYMKGKKKKAWARDLIDFIEKRT